MARPDERVGLSEADLTDADGDPLSYEWFCYSETGTRGLSNVRNGAMHDIVGHDQPRAWLTVKTDRMMPPGTGTIHLILVVTDHGTSRLTRYKRVIIEVVN